MLISSISFILFTTIFYAFFYIKAGQVNLNIIPGALLLLINLFSIAVISFFSSLFLPRMLAPLTGLLIYVMSIGFEIPFYFDKIRMVWTPLLHCKQFTNCSTAWCSAVSMRLICKFNAISGCMSPGDGQCYSLFISYMAISHFHL